METAYAKEHNFPVASVENASGNFVQPTSLNDAIALEAAILHPDLTQDLTGVYTNPLPGTYPLSAYSYLVTQCSPQLASAQTSSCVGGGTVNFPSSKGQALGQFVSYLACAGQEKMALLGYSPLPPNLVSDDFAAVGRLPGGVEPPPPTAANCKNPYVDGETPLPGEPVVQGQSGGGVGVPVTVPGLGGSAGAGAGAGGSGAAGSAAKGAGKSGSGSGSGSDSGSGSGAGTAAGGLTAAQIAAGYRVVNGQVVKTSACEGVDKFTCATALVNASKSLDGLPLADLIAWILVALAIFIAIPLIVLPLYAAGRSVRERSRRAQATLADATAFASENLDAAHPEARRPRTPLPCAPA